MDEHLFLYDVLAHREKRNNMFRAFIGMGGRVRRVGIEYTLYRDPAGKIVRYQTHVFEARWNGRTVTDSGTPLAAFSAVHKFFRDVMDYRPWECCRSCTGGAYHG